MYCHVPSSTFLLLLPRQCAFQITEPDFVKYFILQVLCTMYFTLGWHLLASVQESNKGKSFQHTNLDTGAFLGQGTSEKIYIGKSRMKLFSDGQNVPADDKMFSKLTKQKLPEVESFFCESFLNFCQFFKVLIVLVCGWWQGPNLTRLLLPGG